MCVNFLQITDGGYMIIYFLLSSSLLITLLLYSSYVIQTRALNLGILFLIWQSENVFSNVYFQSYRPFSVPLRFLCKLEEQLCNNQRR